MTFPYCRRNGKYPLTLLPPVSANSDYDGPTVFSVGFGLAVNRSDTETGALLRWYGTAVDIEHRKRSETLLGTENRTLQMVANEGKLSDV